MGVIEVSKKKGKLLSNRIINADGGEGKGLAGGGSGGAISIRATLIMGSGSISAVCFLYLCLQLVLIKKPERRRVGGWRWVRSINFTKKRKRNLKLKNPIISSFSIIDA